MSTWLTDRDAFEALFRSSPSGILAVDERGGFVACNPAFTRITGYAPADMAGANVLESDRLAFRAFAEDAMDATRTGRSLTRQAEFLRPDGASIWCEITSIPAGGDSGVYVFFIFQDITWRNTAEGVSAAAEIGQLRANFRLLFEHNPSVVLSIDTELRITDVNPAGLRASGYRPDQITGEPVTAFVPPSQRDRLRLFLTQALGGETISFPIDAYASDGRLIQYEATALPIISGNRVAGIYGLLENVTDRMRAERTVAAQREELIDLETDFRSFLDHNPDAIALIGTDGIILDVNDAAVRLSGFPRDEAVGKDFRTFLRGEEIDRAWAFFRRAAEGESVRFEITAVPANGKAITLDNTYFPKYVQGVVVGVYAAIQDITERKTAHRKWEMQAQRIRDLYLLATAPEYSDAQVMTTLQTGCRLLGMESGAIVDTTHEPRIDMRYDSLELFGGDDDAVIELAQAVIQRKEPAAAYVGETGESTYVTWIGSRLLVGGTAQGVLIFFSRTRREQEFEEIDLDTLALMSALVGSALERRSTRSHLRTLAYYDPLTGLPNRTYFQERLRDALIDMRGRSHPVAVLFFDLDRFKDINDSLGHAMGDRFLQLVSHRVTRSVGDNGLVARMGGDEFIVLVPNCENVEQIHRFAERLLRAVEEPYRIDDYEQYVTASIGVSIYPADGRDEQSLIKNADIAMYEVKDQGGNGYLFYNESLEAPLQTRLAQEKLLRRAIERNEFTLHFQPIVDVANERLASVEALVRWMDAQRGLVYPDEFIPTAEASGLIVQLGEWIVKTAAKQISDWHHSGIPVSLAVNISGRQFYHPDLCERLEQLLAEAELSPQWVEIEITESMAIADVSHAVQTVQKLKHLGAHIAVDDFGTGHSSLNYLRRFDVDSIKIDRSFVAGIGSEHSDETIVKAIIAMGHSLGLRVVAEGVESLEQFEFLRQHGCDRAQGYLFSRPVDAAAAEPLMRKLLGSATEPG